MSDVDRTIVVSRVGAGSLFAKPCLLRSVKVTDVANPAVVALLTFRDGGAGGQVVSSVNQLSTTQFSENGQVFGGAVACNTDLYVAVSGGAGSNLQIYAEIIPAG